MAPDYKPLKLMVIYPYFKKNFTYNDPFVLNLLNVANRYIFKCERAAKVENGGNTCFFHELGPFLVFIPWFPEKICKFQLIISKFSAFLGVTFSAVRLFEVTGH